jgi:hypothetical protein
LLPLLGGLGKTPLQRRAEISILFPYLAQIGYSLLILFVALESNRGSVHHQGHHALSKGVF